MDAQQKEIESQETYITVPSSFVFNKVSLRDQFAMAALNGIVSPEDTILPAHSVEWAYIHADEMIKQSNEGK